MSKLSDDFGKERSLLVISSAFLLGFSLFSLGIDEKLPFLGIKLPSKELALPITIVLTLYFFVRLILEWAKSDQVARLKLSSKIDFYLTLSIASTALLITVFKLTESNEIWTYPPIATFIILIIGEFVASTTCLNIENIRFIRSKSAALKAGLPRVPVAVRATLVFIPLNVIILSTTSIIIFLFIEQPIKSNWYVIVAIPLFIHLLWLIPSFLFPNRELLTKMGEVFAQHDAAYQIGGWDKFAEGNDSTLYKLSEKGDYPSVKALLEKGSSPDEKNRLGWSPFLICAANGDEKLVKLFIEYGADIDTKNQLGRSALNFVCNYGYLDIAKLLIKAGAKVNLEDTGHAGLPLQQAAQNGFVELVQLLLDNGADFTLKDYHGKTALDYAQENEHGHIAKILRNKLVQKKC